MAEKVQKQVRRPPPKPMPRNKNFVKQWREYRGLTQEQLAEMADMVVSNISQFERQLQGYSAEGLEALAAALNCEPAHLLMVDPTKDDAIWTIWEKARPEQREQIIAHAKVVVGE